LPIWGIGHNSTKWEKYQHIVLKLSSPYRLFETGLLADPIMRIVV